MLVDGLSDPSCPAHIHSLQQHVDVSTALTDNSFSWLSSAAHGHAGCHG